MRPINLVDTLKDYSQGWVALSKDYKRVLYSGRTFSSMMKKIEKEGELDKVVLLPVTKNYRGFVGG